MTRLQRAARWGSAGSVLLTTHALANLRHLREPPRPVLDTDGSAGPSSVSVLIPARDEAAGIGPCLAAVLASRGVAFEVIVLDDESTDDTAGVARRTAAGDPRVRVIDGAPLPPGWLGKPHACAQLAAAATGAVLVFLDADVLLTRDGLARAVRLLDAFDAACPYPRQITTGMLSRLVQPLLQWSWLTFLPLKMAERARHPSLTAANGQVFACRAEAYRSVGGHAAVRGEVIEDLALARALKRAGRRVCIANGSTVAVCQMYATAAELRDGYAKSLWAAFGSFPGSVAVLALLLWLYVVPPVQAWRSWLGGRKGDAFVPAVGYAAGVLGRVLTARRTGGRTVDALAHPLSIIALGALTLLSWWRRLTGRLTWRGRHLQEV